MSEPSYAASAASAASARSGSSGSSGRTGPRGGTGTRALTHVVLPVAGLALLMSGLGLLITHVLAHTWPFTIEDGVNRTFQAHRTHILDDVSAFLSTVANTPTATALTLLAFIGARWYFRRWREALFLGSAVAIEVGVFLLTTVIVHRPRPGVVELDHAPPTSSYPSGHTAAACALYGGLAVLIFLSTRSHWAWLLFLMPVAVGMSRLYRGMHHPSDVLSGLLLGALAITIAKAATGIRERRADEPGGRGPRRAA